MAYTVSSDSVGLAIDSMAETANDVHEALNKARQMYEEGLANVAIADQAGHRIDGDELLECITGKKPDGVPCVKRVSASMPGSTLLSELTTRPAPRARVDSQRVG